MTHKQARISKGFARQQCEAFVEEYDMTIQSGVQDVQISDGLYRDWETDRKSTRLNSSHSAKSRMPSSA